MTHSRGYIAGSTNYTGLPIADILHDLREWKDTIQQTIDTLSKLIPKIEEKEAQFKNPEEVLSFVRHNIEMISRYKHDVERLLTELPRGVVQAHVEVVDQLYRTSKLEERVAIEFKQDWIQRHLEHEEVRPILDEAYAEARGMHIDLRDMSNVAARLATFVGVSSEPPEALPDLHLKPNVFGIGLNFNRILARLRDLWKNRGSSNQAL